VPGWNRHEPNVVRHRPLYGYSSGEMFTMFQSLVVGADADTYRRVDAMEKRGHPSARHRLGNPERC
jgi:hypothetical protein